MIKKVKSVSEKTTISGTQFFNVTTDDDITFSSFDAEFKDSVGKEFDVEIKENWPYKNGEIIKQNKFRQSYQKQQ